MEGTETIIVDYSKIKYYRELHTILRDAMGWPKWYGCNLSALWDIFSVMGTPKEIIFRGTKEIYKHEGWGEAWEKMLRVLDREVAEAASFGEDFYYRIEE